MQAATTTPVADEILRDYEKKAPVWFRWVATLVEHFFTIVMFVTLYGRYLWSKFVQKQKPVSFRNDTVLITGAGGCLGRALAIEFAKECKCLVLLDIQKKPLDDLKHELTTIYGKDHIKISTHKCDLSDLNGLKFTLTAIREDVGTITVLVNCAGVACFKELLHHTDDEIQHTLIVNTVAPILLTKDLLGDMIARNHGHIINITSSAGLSGSAYTSSYSASKAALTSKLLFKLHICILTILTFRLDFTETINQELILAKANGVRATAVMPFHIDGGVYNSLRKFGKETVLGNELMRFDYCARQIMCGLKSHQNPILLPRFALRMMFILRSILPEEVWHPLLIYILGRPAIKHEQHNSLLSKVE
ncbi:unnamed protein product [Didymodactylos carnosus]|uniref:Uncharacterized protein n=1 Tax=Didymodactylos carnosus TaxID=1234261 RepID=A0A813TM31_9BILA|nr:unnamed protein product [Didymodactylos carnosus]CAF0833330.1 unnamed protein product [Didymodactylos carnosus]CAF3598980.1 unnamed protein product [Didymodactylos carnosus]CAF3618000.1 unnamed protein product [Didymodactylos carnosus]